LFLLIFYRKYCINKGFIDIPLDGKFLSTNWKNKKYRVKQKASKLKAAQRATGGGPSVPPLDEETEKILSTIGDDGEFETKFDSECLSSNEENCQQSQLDIILEFDPGPNVKKHFTTVIHDFHNKLQCLSLAVLSRNILYLWVRPGANSRVEHQNGALLELAPALLANIGLSWKGFPGTFTLAYYKNS